MLGEALGRGILQMISYSHSCIRLKARNFDIVEPDLMKAFFSYQCLTVTANITYAATVIGATSKSVSHNEEGIWMIRAHQSVKAKPLLSAPRNVYGE